MFFTLAEFHWERITGENPEGERDKSAFLKKYSLLKTQASTNLMELNLSSVNTTIFFMVCNKFQVKGR